MFLGPFSLLFWKLPLKHCPEQGGLLGWDLPFPGGLCGTQPGEAPAAGVFQHPVSAQG